MPDFNPNDMDALFREGAEKYEFEYNPNAWAMMEEKLDHKSKKRRIIFFILGLVLLMVAILSYTYIKENKESDKESLAAIIQLKATEKKQTEILDTEKEAALIKQQSISSGIIPRELKKEYISTDSKVSSINIGAQNSIDDENTGNLVDNRIFSTGSQIEAEPDEKQTLGNDVIDNNAEFGSGKNSNSLSEKTGVQLLSFPKLTSNSLVLSTTDRMELESLELNPAQIIQLPFVLTSSNNRLAATIFANPEWSSVGLFKESQTGWSFGGRLGYQFADKFEVSGGVAYSRKIYKGVGDSYEMEGGWFNDIEPMQVDAKCDVVEIPIGLSYYFNGFRNSGFFADLGINSYMMHSEWYGFEYDDKLVRPDRYVEVNQADENAHFIGVGRLAIGYQKVLSNNTSFQIAPYLQFPLTGIGAGQVNVYSSGVQVAIKFNTQ